MALITCPECGKAVSEQAKKCPHCGYGIASHNRRTSISNKKETFNTAVSSDKGKKITAIVLIVAVVVVGLLIFDSMKYNNFSGEYRGDCLGYSSIEFDSDKTGSLGAFSSLVLFDYKISGNTLTIYNIYDTIGTTGFNIYAGDVIIGEIDGDKIYFGNDGEYYTKWE